MRTPLLCLLLVTGCSGGKPDPAPPSDSPAKRPAEEGEVKVNANDLWRAFLDNAIAAEEKYGNGKTLEVTGRVGEVNSDSVGLSVLEPALFVMPGEKAADALKRLGPREREWFRAGAYPPNVVGQLDPAHRKEWAKVKPRQVVTILCFCKGSEKADVSRDVRVVLEMVRLK